MTSAVPEMRQGEVWRVVFHEAGERPAVIVSRNELNRGSAVLVVPCTSSNVERRRRFPNCVHLPVGTAGLRIESVAQAHRIQPVNPEAFMARLGRLPEDTLKEILVATAWSLRLFETIG